MGEAIKEIRSGVNMLLVQPDGSKAKIQVPNQPTVQVDRSTLSSLLRASRSGRGLAAKRIRCSTTDPEGHRISLVVRYQQSTAMNSSHGHLCIDDMQVDLDGYQLYSLQEAL